MVLLAGIAAGGRIDIAGDQDRRAARRPGDGDVVAVGAGRSGLVADAPAGGEAGAQPPYEAVADAVAATLRRQSFATALRQYLQRLAAGTEVEGVDLEAADGPLVQ